MDAADFKRLMDGYVRGTLTEAEREAVEGWYGMYRELNDTAVFADEAAASRIADEVHGRLANHWRGARRHHMVMRWLSAAAVTFFVCGLSWWFVRNEYAESVVPAMEKPIAYVEVVTGVRQVKKLSLPDSSTVWVNALSQLRIPESFGETTREVILDEGEAFFEVVRDAKRPFLVRSGALRTRVLGTAFNVRNYARLEDVSVTVQEGRVQVTDTTDYILANELVAEQRLTLINGNQVALSAQSQDDVATWRQGVFRLENASFNEVAAVINQLHGVELIAADKPIKQHRYTLVIRSTHHLEESLRILCSIHQNQFRRSNNEVTIY